MVDFTGQLRRVLSCRRRAATAGVLLVVALVLAACSSRPSGAVAPGAHRLEGGVVYFAEQPTSPPDYIFPLVSGQYWTNTNVFDLQQLLYRPLYFFGAKGRESIDYSLSMAGPPRYSDHDSVVTIPMAHYRWSDGEPVSARDVGFWINLLKANTQDWASYVPGGFPDNVKRWKAESPSTLVLYLNRSYNPTWFTYNELSQITPLPLAWDRTSSSGQHSLLPPTNPLPDTTPAGARAVYTFLNHEAQDVAGYASSPIWSVVDGPWRLSALTTAGRATFVPNTRYSGPKPTISEFVELPFTSDTAEFNVLETSPALGGPGTGGTQITVGYLPDEDVPQSGRLEADGFRLETTYPAQFDYFEPNLKNPSVGPILRQLYFRQAFQHLVNQTGWIKAFYDGVAVPTYGPIPPTPANPWADAEESVDPFPFSVATASSILTAHGWQVRPSGTTTCVRPGTGAGECGADIRAGEALVFTLMYPSGYSYTASAMANLASEAREVGITLNLKPATEDAVTGTILSCPPSCAWELGNYALGWPFSPDHYPTGEEIFATGALGNVSDYSNAHADRLIEATTTAPPAAEQQALDAYQNYIRAALPNFWQPSPGQVVSLQDNLRGFVFNPYSAITPEDWYFVGG